MRARRKPEKMDPVKTSRQRSASELFIKTPGKGKITIPHGRGRNRRYERSATYQGDVMRGFAGGGPVEEHEYDKD